LVAVALTLLCACATWALAASGVRANDTHRPGLNWVRLAGAEQCLSAAKLSERVEARVGRVLFASADEAELFVDGHVRPGAPGWDVVLEVSDPQGHILGRREMHFDGADCAVIDEGVALVIAVTLYPNTALVEAGIPLDRGTAGSLDALFGAEPTDPDPASLPSTAPTSPSPPAHAAPPPKPPAHAAPGTRTDAWGLALDGAGTAGFGQLPGASLGLSAHVQLSAPHAWPIELGATGLLERTAKAGNGVAGQARFSLLLGSIAVCPWQPSWLPSLSLCAGAEIGRLHVAPSGFAVVQAASSDFVTNLVGSGVLRAPLVGPLYLRAALSLALPLIQRSYGYQTPAATSARLYRMPQVAGRAEIGLGLHF
jgi:hypothetical protein